MNKRERLVAIHYRSLILNSILLFALLISWSCRRKTTATTPVAKTPEIIKAEEAPPAIIPLATAASKTNSFDLGEMNFQIGDYGKAIKFYQTFLNAYPKSEDRDRALYHMGLAGALGSTRDLNLTEAAFKKLIAEFPNSQYKVQAELILGLQAQIEKIRVEVKDRDEKVKRLSEELQKLKDIDMQRRPTRTE